MRGQSILPSPVRPLQFIPSYGKKEAKPIKNIWSCKMETSQSTFYETNPIPCSSCCYIRQDWYWKTKKINKNKRKEAVYKTCSNVDYPFSLKWNELERIVIPTCSQQKSVGITIWKVCKLLMKFIRHASLEKKKWLWTWQEKYISFNDSLPSCSGKKRKKTLPSSL